jgi:hypothetical protein
LILAGDARQYRLQALKAGGGFEVGALLAAMQGYAAFGTLAFPIRVRRKRRGAVKTAGGHHALQ